MSFGGRKGPPSTIRETPSDSQSKEKLIVYVHEYLTHIGAPEAARNFIQEIGWEREPKVTLGPGNESPGFLQSWWNVFWDLYCAAPERRENCDYSQEAKLFHEYGFVNPQVNAFPPQVNGMHGQPAMSPYPSSAASPLNMPGPSTGPDGYPNQPPQGMGGPPFMSPMRQVPQGQPSPHTGGHPGFPGHRMHVPRGPMPQQMMGPGGPEMRFNGPGPGMFGPGDHLRPNVPQMSPHQRLPPSSSIAPPRGMGGPSPGMGGPSPSPMNHFPPGMRPQNTILRPPMTMGNGERFQMMGQGAPPPQFGMMEGDMPPSGHMPPNGTDQDMKPLGAEDMKNSPAGSRNGGTPGSQGGQQGPGSVPPVSAAQVNPGSAESIEHFGPGGQPQFQQENASNRYEEQSEIQKIKESMMAETRQFESGKEDSAAQFLSGISGI